VRTFVSGNLPASS